MFWGGFNTAMELTNTEAFCTGCHEMRDNVFQELQRTIHFTNRSGVRAKCSDCHVPHNWTHKIARKMQASKEVWGKIFGTIDTREKFLDKRLELAQHEWARMKANDSLECRNCHDYDYMDFTRQSPRAAHMHSTLPRHRRARPASTATRASRTGCPTWARRRLRADARRPGAARDPHRSRHRAILGEDPELHVALTRPRIPPPRASRAPAPAARTASIVSQ